jgi:hypothetical protein
MPIHHSPSTSNRLQDTLPLNLGDKKESVSKALAVQGGGNPWIIEGTTIYNNTAYGEIRIWDHTSVGLINHVQYINLTSWITGTNSLDFAFEYNSTEMIPKRAWQWNNISHTVTVEDYDNITSGVLTAEVLNNNATHVEFEDGDINITRLYEFNNATGFYWYNWGKTGTHVETQWFYDWNEITSQFTHAVNPLNGLDLQWITTVIFDEDQTRTVKFEYETPQGWNTTREFIEGVGGVGGKWGVWIKRSVDTISEAYQTGRYVYLDPWWDSNWIYRKSHSILNATGAGTNYPVKIYVVDAAGSDSGNVVYVQNKVRADFGDIRFLDDNDTTELDYWLESYNSTTAIFWVEIADNMTATNNTIYMYYGNNDATTTSNGTDTFFLFDDFEDASINTTLWDVWNTASESGGVLQLGDAVAHINALGSDTNFTLPMRFRTLTQIGNGTSTETSGHDGYGFFVDPLYDAAGFPVATDYAAFYQDWEDEPALKTMVPFDDWTDLGLDFGKWDTNEILVETNEEKFYVNDTLQLTETTSIAGEQSIGFRKYWYTGSARYLWVDWVFVANYTDPEPVHDTWGDEELYNALDTVTLDSLTVRCRSESREISDWDVVHLGHILDVWGYYYWFGSSTGVSDETVQLYVEGNSLGSDYTDTTDSNGFFNITGYVAPSAENWNWALDVQMDVSGMGGVTETAFSDDGKAPLFVTDMNSISEIGQYGGNYTITTQPATIVPSRQIAGNDFELGGTRNVISYDETFWRTINSTGDSHVTVLYETAYWNHSDMLIYDVHGNGGDAGSETLYLYDYHPAQNLIASTTENVPIVNGTHSLNATSWLNGELQVRMFLENTAAQSYIKIDHLAINFTSFDTTNLAERVVVGDSIYDIITLDAKTADVRFNITSIPTTYTLANTTGGTVLSDQISSGYLEVNTTGIGIYHIYLDTGLSYHEIALVPQYPDKSYGAWDDLVWHVNATRMKTSPYIVSDGLYYFTAINPFGVVYQEGAIITADDPLQMQYIVEVPMYRATITNGYNLDIRIDIEFDEVVGEVALSRHTTEWFRLYGNTSGVIYKLTIRDTATNNTLDIKYLTMTTEAETLRLGALGSPIPGTLQLATEYTDKAVDVWTINELSGQAVPYQITGSEPVNLQLDLSNFDILDNLNTTGSVVWYDDFEDGDFTSDPAWSVRGSITPVMSNDSLYGDYSVRCTTAGSVGSQYQGGLAINNTAGFNTSQYMVVVLRATGQTETGQQVQVSIVNGSDYLRYGFVSAAGNWWYLVDPAPTATTVRYIPDNEWTVFVINWKEDWEFLFGTPPQTYNLYLAEYYSSGAGIGSAYFDLIAFTTDLTELQASTTTVHAFVQGSQDYALVEFSDPWDFTEDQDGWDTFVGADAYIREGHLLMSNNTVSSTMEGRISGLNIDTEKYTHIQVKLRVLHVGNWGNTLNGTTISVLDSLNNTIGTATNISTLDKWRKITWDLSDSTEWNGTEAGLVLRFAGYENTFGSFWVEIDQILLTTFDPTENSLYQHITVDLADNDAYLVFFPQKDMEIGSGLAQDTRILLTNPQGKTTEYLVKDTPINILITERLAQEYYNVEFDDPDDLTRWTAWGDDGTWEITNGRLLETGGSTASQDKFLIYKDVLLTDGEITTNIFFGEDSSTSEIHLLFRFVDPYNYMMLSISYYSGTGHIGLYSWMSNGLGGTGSPVTDPNDWAYPISEGTAYNLKLRFSDSVSELFIDDVLAFSYDNKDRWEDAFGVGGYYGKWIGEGRVGLGTSGGRDVQNYFKDFRVVPIPSEYTVTGIPDGEKEFFIDEQGDFIDFIEDADGYDSSEQVEEVTSINDHLILIRETASTYSVIKWTGESISSDLFDTGILRFAILQESDATYGVQFIDSADNAIGSLQNFTTLGFHEIIVDFSADVDWTGVETAIGLNFTGLDTSVSQVILDYMLLSTDKKSATGVITVDPVLDQSALVFASQYVFIDGYLPDGLGARFGDFKWYIDDTRIYNPYIPLEKGNHSYYIQDFYDQTIVDTTVFTVNSALDVNEVSVLLPVYTVGFTSQDETPYFVNITRNAISVKNPVPPMGFTEVRLYGLATNVNYTVSYHFINGTQRGDDYTLSVPNYPIARLIDFDVEVEAEFYIRSFEFAVGDEYLSLLVDTSWNNATINAWSTPHSPEAAQQQVLTNVGENEDTEWVILNDERNANWVDVAVNVSSGSETKWYNFTYSYRKEEDIQFPAYKSEFDNVTDTMEAFGTLTIQLILLAFLTLGVVIILQRRSIGRSVLEKPLVDNQ